MINRFFRRFACPACCMVIGSLLFARGDAAPVRKGLEKAKAIVIKNAQVKAVFEIGSDGLLKENYYSFTKKGDWALVISQFTPHYKSMDTAETQLWNTHFNPYRFLMQSMKASALSKQVNEQEQKVLISFNERGNVFTQVVVLKNNESYFHLEVDGQLIERPARLDYCLSAYTFRNKGIPDFVHSPGVKFDDVRSGLGRDQVLGDRAFHSPAVILQQQSLFAAMIPDLRLANEANVLSYDARQQVLFKPNPQFLVPVPPTRVTMPVGIDLNVNTGLSSSFPVLTYGLMDTKIGYHTRFVRDEKGSRMVRTLYNGRIKYGFDLLLNSVEKSDAGYAIAARHIWKQSGEPVFTSMPHLAMPFIEYLELVRSKVFSPVRDKDGKLYVIPGGTMDPPVEGYADHGPWLEWVNNGKKIGGFRCAAPFWSDVINNSVFWNQARDAVGIFYWAKELEDTFLLSRARMMINFCLSAPRNKQGLFATVFNGSNKTWGIGWSDPPHNENKLFMRYAKSYEIPPLCKTGAHLLDYYLRAEKDQRIIDYLLPFANWLLTVIDDKGVIPSYVTDDMKISPILYESAQPAAGMWFLAQMYNVTREEKYLEGAKRIAGYIEREIIPTAKWTDMEQYVSCGQKPFSMVKDAWQGQWFRGNLCIMWACEGFAALNHATADERWLKSGEKCIDYLSLTQAAWSPRFVYTANSFGGFGADNSDDAAMMDQRQAEFVKAFIDYGLKLNRLDLLQRGVAAGQAGCVLILSERHIKNGITPAPKFYPEGFGPENIDHEGISQWPMRTHTLWGEGLAVFTGLSEIRRELGGLYIDPANDIAIATDGIRINAHSVNPHGIRVIDVESFMSKKYFRFPYEKDFPIDVIIKGGPAGKILLNNSLVKSGKMSMVIKAK